MGLGDIFKFVKYTDDEGQGWVVKVSQNEFNSPGNGGSGGSISPTSLPAWPYGIKNLRHVWGKDPFGHRTKMKCFALSAGIYQGTQATFSLNGRTYTVQGRKGEFKDTRYIGGS